MVPRGKSYVDLVNSNNKEHQKQDSDKQKNNDEKAKSSEAFNDGLDKAYEDNKRKFSDSDLQKILKKNNKEQAVRSL